MGFSISWFSSTPAEIGLIWVGYFGATKMPDEIVLRKGVKYTSIEVEILDLLSPKISVCSRVFLHLSAQPRYIKLIRRNI